MSSNRRQGGFTLGRLLYDRSLWKQAIYAVAFLTYLASFLFFVLGVVAFAHGGQLAVAVMDLLVGLYFLVQVIFLFVLSWFVERRHHRQAIGFPDRRSDQSGESDAERRSLVS
jgi:membrane protein implicated in regulation of membrane protease activity